ncbi:MAG: OmpA family protein [Desulfuromonas sp.]|nr:OmpA family protein [Desulfuromonas sp.]
MKINKFAAVLVLGAFVAAGCAQPMSKTQKGAAYGTGIGAVVGAGLGQAIGGDTKGTLIGAGIGAAVGGLAGAGIGRYMENQEAALQQNFAASESASIQRDANVLAVTFKSDVLFDSGSASLKPGAYQEINRVSQVLTQYPETRIMVAGHTDSDGSEAFNQDLSVRRAEAIRNALVSQGVSTARITTAGFGESQPVADNNTAAGKQLNRRVVITIVPQNA